MKNREHSRAPARTTGDALRHVTEEISTYLDQGVMPWRAPWDTKLAYAATPGLPLRANGEPYRGANIFLLWAAQLSRGYTKRTWMTFRQALALGANVRKGERACPVIYYGRATPKTDMVSTTDTSENVRPYRFLKLFHVFNIAQIDGLDPAFGAETNPGPPPSMPLMHDWVSRAGARIRVGGQSAFYSPALDTIQIPPLSAFIDEDHWSATLAHEAVHFTGHKSRLDRLTDYATDPKARAREELCAELGSAILGAMTGLAPAHLEDHAAYIASWRKLLVDEPRAFLSAGAKAQAAVDWLIDKAGDPM